MKYVSFDNGDFVIFPETMTHIDVALSLRATRESVKGAGFIRFEGRADYDLFAVDVECFGRSGSLDKDVHPDDAKRIDRFINNNF